jgi:hypothetical protein
MYALLFAPMLLHVLALAHDIGRHAPLTFEWLDLFVFVFIAGYSVAGVLALRRRERGLNFLLASGAAVVTLLAAEAVLSALNPMGVPRFAMRHVAWASDTMPGIEGKIRFTINRFGVRAPELFPADRDDRILCIGGSSVECLYVPDEQSWPWLLGTRLSDALGRPILVANAGVGGHFTLHHEYQLAHYRYADRFGRVIVMCGINDAGTLLRDNYEARARSVPREALVDPVGEGAYYRRSSLLRLVYGLREAGRIRETSVHRDPWGRWYAGERARRKALLERRPIRSVPPGLPAALETYRQNLLRIVGLCRERGQKLLFLTQPTLYSPDMPRELADLIWEHTDDGAHTPEVLWMVMEAYNGTLRRVAREAGVPCIDLASLLPKDTTVLYDDCHFNVSGCARVADILAERLLTPPWGLRGVDGPGNGPEETQWMSPGENRVPPLRSGRSIAKGVHYILAGERRPPWTHAPVAPTHFAAPSSCSSVSRLSCGRPGSTRPPPGHGPSIRPHSGAVVAAPIRPTSTAPITSPTRSTSWSPTRGSSATPS